ncbi:hypothetical protein SAMN04487949_3402 [Halogranum gelatinilyticum]|uniref:Uncharacterized protein n=1 Tax=Halogranum gelatinilyticum TaxID=660521 RepID=A0A1G9YRK2_9EURY|nr:hypothetical protein [Halogranum gelatinilyticum]SDN11016.1 hypothetical protein SAMN04487949_3402 [Halogranum gelatinilyticum]
MESRTRYPQLVAVARAVLYLLGAVGVVALAGFALSFLVLVGVLATATLLLVGEGSASTIAAVGGLGLVSAGLLACVWLAVTRRVDRYLVRASRIPSPLEQVTRQYVDGHIDEWGLERGLERALAAESSDPEATVPATTVSPAAARELAEERA